MRAITEAITARHAQIKTLQADIDALQRAASVLGGKSTAKATRQPRRSPSQAAAAWDECRRQEGRIEADEGVLGEAEGVASGRYWAQTSS